MCYSIFMRAIIHLALAAALLPLVSLASVPKEKEPGTRSQEPASAWTPQPASRYEGILERMPFGRPPPAPAAAAATTAPPAPAIANQLVLCAINRTPGGGIAVGFVDNAQKPPRSYYLSVGENADGFVVVAADFEKETVIIDKDGVRVEISMGKGSAVANNAPPSAPPSPPQSIDSTSQNALPLSTKPAEPVRAGIVLRPSQGNVAATGNLALGIARMEKRRQEIAKVRESGGDTLSYVLQLRDREAKEREAKALAEKSAWEQIQSLAAKLTAEQLAKREHEINLALIEQGASPVSDVRLSPEEEKALVEKGVLPP